MSSLLLRTAEEIPSEEFRFNLTFLLWRYVEAWNRDYPEGTGEQEHRFVVDDVMFLMTVLTHSTSAERVLTILDQCRSHYIRTLDVAEIEHTVQVANTRTVYVSLLT